MNKTYQYRFFPNKEQNEMLAKTFGCVRFVYNHTLDWRSKEYTNNQTKINYNSTSKKLTDLKNQYEWLKDVSSVPLQQVLRNQDKAFSNFFAKRAKYPNFKKKNNHQSFRLMKNAFKIIDNQIYIAKIDEPLDIKFQQNIVVFASIFLSHLNIVRIPISKCLLVFSNVHLCFSFMNSTFCLHSIGYFIFYIMT